MPDLKKLITLEALQAALPSWLKSSSKPSYTADEISDTNTANKFVTSTDKSNWNAKGTYSKPTGGIPKSDLSQLVQNSLDLADSALQSESDPTVPSWAKQTNKPSYTQDEVTDGTTYKRVTSTEKNTWNNKQSALTTTQMQAVNSGITSEEVTQISTNQTNILYAINTGVKNFANAQAPSEVKAGLTVTNLDNEAVKLSATSQAWTAYYIGNTKVLPNTQYVISIYADSITNAPNFYFSVRDTDNSGETLVSNKRITSTGETSATFTSISDTLIINVYPNNSSTALTTDVTIRIMLCKKSVYDQDPSYQPHALPNSDLTQLESEDRAALAEEIDAGAKNISQWSGGTAASDGAVIASLIPITVDSNSNTYMVRYDTTLPNGIITIGFKNSSGTNVTTLEISNIAKQRTVVLPSTVTQFSAVSSKAGTISNFMICTLADWKVSQKFVPYYNPASPVLGGGYEIPQNSSMDSLISIGKWRCYNSDVAITVTNTPFRNGFFGWTTNSITDSTRYVQIAIENADVFVVAKRRWNGTIWSDWEYISSDAVNHYKADTTTTIGTDWTLTSIVLQAPVDALVPMTVMALWGAKAPRGIRITRTNTSATNNVIATIEVSEDKGQIQASGFGAKLNGVNTYYVWAKAKESGTMPVYLTYSYPIKD